MYSGSMTASEIQDLINKHRHGALTEIKHQEHPGMQGNYSNEEKLWNKALHHAFCMLLLAINEPDVFESPITEEKAMRCSEVLEIEYGEVRAFAATTLSRPDADKN